MQKHAIFIDGEERQRHFPSTFQIPTQKQRQELRLGDKVKVGLTGSKGKHPTPGERFWVKLMTINESCLTGTVTNALVYSQVHGVDYGDTLTFETKHVLDIDPADEIDLENGNYLPEIARA